MNERGRGIERMIAFVREPPRALLAPLEANVRGCFLTASSPWGDAWERQSAATLARRAREGKPEGFARLAERATAVLTATGVRVGAAFEQARRFHEGSSSQPARPFLPSRDGLVDPPAELRAALKRALSDGYRAAVRG